MVLHKTAPAMPDPKTEFKGDTQVHVTGHVASLSAMLGNSGKNLLSWILSKGELPQTQICIYVSVLKA